MHTGNRSSHYSAAAAAAVRPCGCSSATTLAVGMWPPLFDRRPGSWLHHRSDRSAHCGRCLAVLCPARLATSVPATFSHYDHSSIALRPLLYRCRWSSHRAFLVRLVPVCSGSWFGCCRIAPIFVHFLHTHCYFSYTRTSISPYLTL